MINPIILLLSEWSCFFFQGNPQNSTYCRSMPYHPRKSLSFLFVSFQQPQRHFFSTLRSYSKTRSLLFRRSMAPTIAQLPFAGNEPYWCPDENNFEELERYREGGFCPITIWQLLNNGRYRVVYKLGNGYFSTVWLAQDLHAHRYVALKILTADQYAHSREAEMLRAIAKHTAAESSATEGSQNFLGFLDTFNYTSPNGTHHVIVTTLTRPLMGIRSLNLDFRAVVKSLISCLVSLQAAGIVHGDIHTSNIGYGYTSFSDEQFEDMVPPACHIIPPLDQHRPPYLVSREEWTTERQLDKKFKDPIVPQLLDFGNSFFVSEMEDRAGKKVAVPEFYIPPEHVFEREKSRYKDTSNYGELNERTDVWMLGAAIFELAVGQPLVRERWGSTPESVYLSINNRVAEHWNLSTASNSPQIPIEKFWEEAFGSIERGPISVGDKDLFKQFILDMVALDPQKRLPPTQLLNHKYLEGA
ncbi:kinase-like domain-containing protein [Xylariales sp. PMI_506]|nr:kinase-like domain-containing protein [Xylariales sp. PMI_506]